MWSNFSGRCLPSSVAHRKPVHSLCIKYSWFSDLLQWQLADTLVFVSQEEPAPTMQGRRSSLSRVCYLTMGLLVLLLGLVFASMYVYRYFFITQVGASLEGLLVLSWSSQTSRLSLWKRWCCSLLLCTVVTWEPVLWALQSRHVLSGGLRLTSVPTARKGLLETLSCPPLWLCFDFFFLTP